MSRLMASVSDWNYRSRILPARLSGSSSGLSYLVDEGDGRVRSELMVLEILVLIQANIT